MVGYRQARLGTREPPVGMSGGVLQAKKAALEFAPEVPRCRRAGCAVAQDARLSRSSAACALSRPCSPARRHRAVSALRPFGIATSTHLMSVRRPEAHPLFTVVRGGA